MKKPDMLAYAQRDFMECLQIEQDDRLFNLDSVKDKLRQCMKGMMLSKL